MTKTNPPSVVDERLKAIGDDRGDFDTSLGSFLSLFATIESSLLFIVQHYAATDWVAVKAMLSPLRVENAVNTVKRLIEARRLRGKRVEEILSILDQLMTINGARNDILHHGLHLDPRGRKNWFVVTNLHLARTRRAVFKFQISKKHLDQMRHDLLDIYFRLSVRHMGTKVWRERKNAVRFASAFPLGAPIPWRYKSPLPSSNRPKRRAHVQAQRHRLRPSQG